MNHAILPMIMVVCTMSLTLISQSKVAPVLCLLKKRGKLHVNVQQIDATEWLHTLWPMKFCPKAVLQMVRFSLIAKLTLTTVGLLESKSFEKHKMRGHNQLQLHARKISMTYTLNSDTIPRPSPMPPLKPLVFKSLVHSNHVKIVL